MSDQVPLQSGGHWRRGMGRNQEDSVLANSHQGGLPPTRVTITGKPLACASMFAFESPSVSEHEAKTPAQWSSRLKFPL